MSELFSPADFYRLIRSQIEHEDNLNSQRLSWFVASQAFLFTAYAIAIGNSSGKTATVEHQLTVLVFVIPIVALITCGLIYATIIAGSIAMVNLRKMYKTHEHGNAGALPPVQGYRLTQVFGQAGPLGVPPVFMVVWIGLVVQGIISA